MFTRAVRPKIRPKPVEYLDVTKRHTAAEMERVKMCMGGITRSKDLGVITRFRGGHLDRLQVDSSLSSDTDTHNPVVPLRRGSRPPIDTSLLTRSGPQFSLTSQQTRGFHTSSPHPYDSTSYNVTDVPDFFVKYKQHRATSASSKVDARKSEELGLMQSVADSILSGDIVATTRRLKAKIPVEHHVAEGHVVHPSGFVVPGPGHSSTSDVARAKEKERNDKMDRLVQTAAVANRVLESDFEQVNATTLPSSHKVPFEVCEADGTVKHPSGFVPPTPADKFRYSVNSSVLWDRKVSVVQRRVRQPSPSRAVLRAMHTNASVNAVKRPGA